MLDVIEERERRVSLSSQSGIKVLKSLSGSLGRPEQPRLFFSFWIQQTEISDYSLALAFVAKKKAMMSFWSSWRHSESCVQCVHCSHDVVTKWPVTSPRSSEACQCDWQLWPWYGSSSSQGKRTIYGCKCLYIIHFKYSNIHLKRIFNVTFSKSSKLDHHPESRGHLLPLSDRHE